MNQNYSCFKFLVSMAIMFLLCIESQAQTKTVSGTVNDGLDNTPLPGASVLVSGTTIGSITDVNGKFNLSVPASAESLVFSYVGYVDQTIPITGASQYDIVLKPEEGALDEIVVIGYGSKQKKDLTGAISTVSTEEISKSVAQSPELAMQGRMAGVYVSTPGGSAFARPQVRIRGISTFGYAEPLYVVDGIPLTEYGSGITDGLTGDIRGGVNVLAMINPNDIESMSVLKDASAAAIYGVRAANGVILITTKKGKSGAPKIDMSISHSIQNVVKKLDMLNVNQYVNLYREAYANNPNEAENIPEEFVASSPNYLGNSETYDWQTPLINSNAPNTDYSLRVSGGNEFTKYYVSGGYSTTEGSLQGNAMDRLSLAMNVDSKVNKYISTGVNFRLSHNQVIDQGNAYGDLRYAAETSPWQPIYDPNGPYGFAPSINANFIPNPALGQVFENFTRPQYLPSIPPFIFDGDVDLLYGPETNNNSFGRAATSDTRYTLLRNMGSAFAQLEPIPGLKLKGTVSVDWLYNRRNQWSEFDNYLFSQTAGNPYNIGNGTSKGTYGERHTKNLNIIKEFSINYTKVINQNHHLDLLVNAMDQKYSYEFMSGSSSQILFSEEAFRNINTVIPYVNSASFRENNALQGYLGRVSYHYKSKYYLDATVRRDGASRFAPGYKWGTFPAVSGAWRISQESFMKDLTFIDDLKIRGGWGRLGNQETRSFAYLSLISDAPDYAFGSGNGNGIGTLLNGSSLPDFPVEDLSWEIGETYSLGFDGSFFNGKMTTTIEYYNRITSGILQAAALPASVGNQNAPILNIAAVRNKGMEFQLGYNGNLGELQYNFSGNLTTVDNTVEKTFRDQPFGGEFGRIEVGMPMNYLWGYKVGGIFQNQAEIDAWKANNTDGNNNDNFQPGDMYFQDVSGPDGVPDGVVNAEDRTFLANTIPGFYYGFNIGANYKGFDLAVFFQGVGDIYRYNGARANGEGMSGAGNNLWTTTLDRWTEANPSTTMPRAVRSDPAGNNRFSDRFIESAAFLRLKNVQLGYAVPGGALESLGFINGARIYVGGTNLFVASKWTGLDPEDTSPNGGLIPPVRSFTTGITASF